MAEMMNPALEGPPYCSHRDLLLRHMLIRAWRMRSRHIRPAHGLERRL